MARKMGDVGGEYYHPDPHPGYLNPYLTQESENSVRTCEPYARAGHMAREMGDVGGSSSYHLLCTSRFTNIQQAGDSVGSCEPYVHAWTREMGDVGGKSTIRSQWLAC